jgi:hypothetical protein
LHGQYCEGRISEKLYEFLLKLYPDHFRRTYGDEALRLVRDRARSEKGFLPGLRLWLDLLLDLAKSLPREYSNAPTTPIVTTQLLNGERSFQLLAERSLNPTLLCLGCTLSAVLFWLCVFVVAHSGGFPTLFPALLSLQGLAQSTPAQAYCDRILGASRGGDKRAAERRSEAFYQPHSQRLRASLSLIN